MRIRLPNGLLDGSDLFNYAEIDELRGKQQNYLADKELLENYIGHVPKIITDMLLSLETESGLKWKGKMEDAVWKLSSGDLETILVKIRENTYGPKFIHELTCEHCGEVHSDMKLDLSELEMDTLAPEEVVKPKKVKLPKQKVEVELKPIYLKDLFNIIEMTAKEKTNKMVTSLLATSIKRIGKKDDIKPSDIDDIPVTDLMYLQEQVEKLKIEGHIDTMIEFTCKNKKCKKENSVKMNCFDPSFLAPTRGSTS